MMEGVPMDTPTFGENDVTSGVLAYQAFHDHSYLRSGWGGRPGDEASSLVGFLEEPNLVSHRSPLFFCTSSPGLSYSGRSRATPFAISCILCAESESASTIPDVNAKTYSVCMQLPA